MKEYAPYELPQAIDLKQLMNERAEKTPDDVAFFFTEDDGSVRKVTCREFRDDVNGLGTYLYAKGFRGGRHCGIVGPNSYEWLVAFFALVNGGNVALPLDARQPVENLIRLMARGDCASLVYSKEFAPAVPAFAANLSKIPAAASEGFLELPMTAFAEYIAEGKKLLAAGETGYADHEVDANALAAILFTSGTTGEPKGVMLSQDNFISNMNQASKNYFHEGVGMGPLPMHHMFGLVVGHLMVYNYCTPCYIVRNIRNIMKDLQIAKPSTLFAVPMIIETFVKQFRVLAKRAGAPLSPEMIKQATGGKLKYIICGGAPLSVQYVKLFRTFGVELLNGYGITECSPVLAVNRNEDFCDGSVGPVLFGCEVKIDDDGEILARGRNVMLGYYKDPAATEEAMKGGWYHTGDLGKIEDHYLFITGRTKNLIITASGENVSPEELEEKFLQDPAVAEAIVYEKDGSLIVQIYPEQEANAPAAYFDALLARANQGEPVYRKVQKVILRDEPFVRNSTGNIVRRLIET